MSNKRTRPKGQPLIRMISHGMDIVDAYKLFGKTEVNLFAFRPVQDGEDFVKANVELADQSLAYAEEQLSLGRKLTASKFFHSASTLYRLADYTIINPTEEKLSVNKKKVECFKKWIETSGNEEIECVEIPFEHSTLPAYLTIPKDAPKDVPVVIITGGATGYKEENYCQVQYFIERGVATLIFDGPGQGEAMLFRDYLYTVDNYEKAAKAVIDFIHADPRLGDKIAIYGMSYGGYLAPRCACFLSDELVACVGRGGTSKTNDLVLAHGKKYLQNFKVKFNEYDDDKAMAICDEMNIEPYVKDITCSLLVVHTTLDSSYDPPADGARFIYENASTEDKELVMLPGPSHCATHEEVKISNYIADWVVERLNK